MKSFFPPFSLKSLAVAVGLVFTANAAFAVEPFVIQDIKIDGLQRVDAGTVFASIPVKVGDTYDDEHGAAAIRSLFALGLFQDVRVDVRGSDMVIVVQERPIINQLDISVPAFGAIDKAGILKGLGNLGLMTQRPYDKGMENRAVQELLKQYQNMGYYAVEIIPTVTPTEKNQVNINFDIQDGQPAKIKEIRFIGNTAFSASTLQDEMQMDTGNWMSWYTKSNRYTDNKFNTDINALSNFYRNKGYLEFRVSSTQVGLSPDKKNIEITINIDEGKKYVVSAITLLGDYLDKEDAFKSLVTIKPGEAYKLEDITNTVTAIKKHFGNYGYAFAKVDVRPKIDREKQQVELVLAADPGQRAYVRRINVAGNAKTRDEVIRRELRQYEASWYNADKISLSKDRLERLGYFTEINIDTQPVAGVPDQADLEVAVKERPTGAIQLGAGYSSSDKLELSFNLNQDNIFGSGQSFAFGVNTGSFSKNYSISSTDPYFTDYGISRTFYFTHSVNKPREGQGGDYSIKQDNFGLSFGVPFSEKDQVYFGAAFERYGIKAGNTDIPPVYQDYINSYGTSAFGIPLTVGWGRDSRDSAVAPTSGSMQRISAAVSPAGDMKYFLATYKFQQYFPLSKNIAFMFNTDVGYGKGLSCRDSAGSCFPFYKNFFMGGLGSIRGFEPGGIGPKQIDPVTGASYSVGGSRMFNVNFELLSPFPGAGNDKTLRLFAFLDAGNVYSETFSTYQPTSQDRKIRASTGFGLRWISPIGPLSLSFGSPFKKQASDKLQKFQFQIGTSF